MGTVQRQNAGFYKGDIVLGIAGLFMPALLAIGGAVIHDLGLQPSISDYYYTPLGAYHAAGLLLFALYFLLRPWADKREKIAALLISNFAVLSIIFPAPQCVLNNGQMVRAENISGLLHLVFACCLFFAFTYLVFFVFWQRAKPDRQSLYLILGCIMLLSSIGIGGLSAFGQTCHTPTEKHVAVFWLEALALSAFWVAWLMHRFRERRV